MTSFEAMVAEVKTAADHRALLVLLARPKETSRLVLGAISALSSLRTGDRVVAVIVEVKRPAITFVDPSDAGGPGMLARFYAVGSAIYVPVITGPSVTRDSLRDLGAVRTSMDLPVLANDLVATPYQVHEARAYGADLLILGARLETLVLEGFIERIHSPGMGAVAEARTRHETLTAVDARARIVAIDTRDSDTLAVDCSLFGQVIDVLPTQVVRTTAGGVRGPHDVMSFARCGVDVTLVGGATVRSTDPQQFVAKLTAAGTHSALTPSAHREVF